MLNLVMPGQAAPAYVPQSPANPDTTNPYDLTPVRAALEPYLEQIDTMAEQAQAVAITDEASQAKAVEMAGQVKRLGKAIETARVQFVAAPNDYVKQVNGLGKGILAKLESIERGLKAKMSEYAFRVEQERLKTQAAARQAAIEAQRKIDEENRLAREAAEKEAAEARARAEAAAKAGDEDAARLAEIAKAEEAKAQVVAEMPVVQVEAPVIPKASGPVRTAAGTASTKKVWKFEITDAQSVPREYLAVDEKAIREAVKAGVRSIPGVNIFETNDIAIRA
jgi:hypothetical protein